MFFVFSFYCPTVQFVLGALFFAVFGGGVMWMFVDGKTIIYFLSESDIEELKEPPPFSLPIFHTTTDHTFWIDPLCRSFDINWK